MYKVQLSDAYFPAQEGPPQRLMTVGASLREAATVAPERPAIKELLSDGTIERVWTYRTLLEDTERLARALASRHAEGARVAVYANNVPEWLLLEYACGLAGVTLVTVNPAYQKRELKYVLEQSSSEAIYYVGEFRGNPMREISDAVCDELPAIKHRILLTDHHALFDGFARGEMRDPKPGDPIQIQYTSGTTGFPKGAILHHQGLVQNSYDYVIRAGVGPGDVFVHHMPMFHTSGCALLALGCLGVGATMLLAPAFDPDMIVRVIARERSKFVLGVPTMLVALIDAVERSGADMSSVRSISSGGAMVAPELCRRAKAVLNTPIQIVYGQTESSPAITQAWPDDSLEDMTQTIGQPVAHTEVSMRDPQTNRVVPIGIQGEICSRGYNTMLGYNDNPEATAKAIDKDGWLHTGDLGTMDARGYVKITGRVKEMIIRGGENLFPAEIENAILEHELVAEVAVVGVPDERWGEQAACFMRASGATRPDAETLKAFIRERLSPQKTPAYWIWVEQWPLTGSGKIQKFKLREAFENGEYHNQTPAGPLH
ncbi:MAG: AMP-binding protein [Proteobacteria bacterium]|nr:AMP-binding protein [Pseudomonadota bacterium]